MFASRERVITSEVTAPASSWSYQLTKTIDTHHSFRVASSLDIKDILECSLTRKQSIFLHGIVNTVVQ